MYTFSTVSAVSHSVADSLHSTHYYQSVSDSDFSLLYALDLTTTSIVVYLRECVADKQNQSSKK